MPCWPKDSGGYTLGSNANYDRVLCCLARWHAVLHECKHYVRNKADYTPVCCTSFCVALVCLKCSQDAAKDCRYLSIRENHQMEVHNCGLGG